MKTTKTRQVARKIISAKDPKKSFVVFNDRLADGRRSLKVWGWNETDYTKAAKMLKAMGCKVVKVKTPEAQSAYAWYSRQQRTRLWVTE